MGINHLFQSIRIQIEEDAENARAIADVEADLNKRISETRYKLSSMLDLTPIELENNAYTCLQPGERYSFSQIELRLLEDGDLPLLMACENFHDISDRIEKLKCSPGAKERLKNKLKEETFFFMLASRYFNSVAYHFMKHASPETLSVNAITRNDQCGLVMLPEEINTLLKEDVFAHSPYLAGLLELAEILPDYTTNTIIKVSTDPNRDDPSIKGQYSLALLNLSLLTHLQSDFQMLDLKNDGLRRKYDKLKYNVKKANGIVYDLSLRNLCIFKAEVVDV